MRIDVMDVVVGVGVGVADQLAEKFDADRGNTGSWKGISNWGRVGVAALGYLGQMMNFQPKLAHELAMSATPLATKTIMAAVMGATGMGSSAAHATRTTRATSVTTSGGKVTWRPVAIS